MKIVVRVELVTHWGEKRSVEVGRVDRPSQTLGPDDVGLTLDDGKRLLRSLQQSVVHAQAEEIDELSRICRGCHRRTPIKDYRQRKVDTMFGTVTFRSPRIITCDCDPPFFLTMPLRPLRPIVPERATPELQALQARLAAQMSYRQAAAMMREFLPIGDKVNHGTIRNRTLRVGARIDKVVVPQTVVPLNSASTDWTMAIDGGFVHGRSRGGSGNFELLVGRLKAPGAKPYVFAWVRGEVESTVDRISMLATTQAGASRPCLTFITDGASFCLTAGGTAALTSARICASTSANASLAQSCNRRTPGIRMRRVNSQCDADKTRSSVCDASSAWAESAAVRSSSSPGSTSRSSK